MEPVTLLRSPLYVYLKVLEKRLKYLFYRFCWRLWPLLNNQLTGNKVKIEREDSNFFLHICIRPFIIRSQQNV